MLSNKWTFSLIGFVVLVAFGLICAVPFASADDGDEAHIQLDGTKAKSTVKTHIAFDVTLSAAESMMDISYRGDDNANNIQIIRRAAGESTIQLLATFGVVVHLDDPDIDEAEADEELKERAGPFELKDVIIDAYDEEGRALGILDLGAEVVDVVTLSHRDPNNPGREFLIQIDEDRLEDAYTIVRGGGTTLTIGTILVSIPGGSVEEATLSEVIRARQGLHVLHQNKYSNVFQIDLVDVDTWDAWCRHY